MNHLKKALLGLALLCAGAISVPAFAADNVDVTAGSGKTMACKDIAGVCHSKVIDVTSAGVEVFLLEEATPANGDPGVGVLTIRRDTAASSSAAGKYAMLSTDANGLLWVREGLCLSAELAATSSVGDFTPCQLQKAMVGAMLSTADQPVAGGVAHGAAATASPVPIGGKCLTADPTFEATGDAVNGLFTCGGKLVVQPYALKANLVSGLTAAMTGTTSTAVTGVGAPGANLFNYITSAVCGNSHATVGTFVEFQDGSGGTTFYTIPAAAVYGGSSTTFPAPLKQPTANTALFVKDTTTGANVICSVSGYTAP